ncbi:MAG: MaoC/PaaZ C-terminal domain-containing protein [Pseudomonadota bacterium]
MGKYFEDLEIGQIFQSQAAHTMTRDAIVAYAQEWDPQLYHIDENAAAQSPVGRIFASAFHSMAVAQKLAHEAGAFDVLPIVGLGITDLTFPKPVIEGDDVRTRVTVKEKRPSRSKPDQGLVTLHIELLNQNDDVVLQYTLTELVRRQQAQ